MFAKSINEFIVIIYFEVYIYYSCVEIEAESTEPVGVRDILCLGKLTTGLRWIVIIIVISFSTGFRSKV